MIQRLEIAVTVTTRSGRKYTTHEPLPVGKPADRALAETSAGFEDLIRSGGVFEMNESAGDKELPLRLVGVSAADIEAYEVEIINAGE